MAIRIENSPFWMVNVALRFCPPLKAFGRKEETGKRRKAAKKSAGSAKETGKKTGKKPACHLYE
jgi:hypothetical protein